MQRVSTPAGVTISYDQYGSGPPLVLVHGSFSDHNTNWGFVRSLSTRQFTLTPSRDEVVVRAIERKVTIWRTRDGTWRR